jgi:hypothetical protein
VKTVAGIRHCAPDGSPGVAHDHIDMAVLFKHLLREFDSVLGIAEIRWMYMSDTTTCGDLGPYVF